jgi:hypothetical protein
MIRIEMFHFICQTDTAQLLMATIIQLKMGKGYKNYMLINSFHWSLASKYHPSPEGSVMK